MIATCAYAASLAALFDTKLANSKTGSRHMKRPAKGRIFVTSIGIGNAAAADKARCQPSFY
jgi:hypothetical protein